MKLKIALILILVVIVSSIVYSAEEKCGAECKFNKDPSNKNFEGLDKEKQTSDNFKKIKEKPSLNNYKKIKNPSSSDLKHLVDNNEEISAEQESDALDRLGPTGKGIYVNKRIKDDPERAGKVISEYVKKKTGKTVDITITEDNKNNVIFTEGEDGSISLTGTGNGKTSTLDITNTPPNVKGVEFDQDNGEWKIKYEKEGIESTIMIGGNAKFGDDGSILINPGGHINTGEDSEIKFDDNSAKVKVDGPNMIIEGKGTWTKYGQTIDFGQQEGKQGYVTFTTPDGTKVSRMTGKNSYMNKGEQKSEGNFEADFDKGNGEMVRVSVDKKSRYVGPKGKARGAEIKFQITGDWKEANVMEGEVEYGKHLLEGPGSMNFHPDGKPDYIDINKLNGRSGRYIDKKTKTKLTGINIADPTTAGKIKKAGLDPNDPFLRNNIRIKMDYKNNYDYSSNMMNQLSKEAGGRSVVAITDNPVGIGQKIDIYGAGVRLDTLDNAITTTKQGARAQMDNRYTQSGRKKEPEEYIKFDNFETEGTFAITDKKYKIGSHGDTGELTSYIRSERGKDGKINIKHQYDGDSYRKMKEYANKGLITPITKPTIMVLDHHPPIEVDEEFNAKKGGSGGGGEQQPTQQTTPTETFAYTIKDPITGEVICQTNFIQECYGNSVITGPFNPYPQSPQQVLAHANSGLPEEYQSDQLGLSNNIQNFKNNIGLS